MSDNVLFPYPYHEWETRQKELIKEALTEWQPPQPEQSQTPEYLTRKQVAKLLHISLPTLNEWTKRGILQAHRMANRVYYKQHEIESALQEVKSVKYKRGI